MCHHIRSTNLCSSILKVLLHVFHKGKLSTFLTHDMTHMHEKFVLFNDSIRDERLNLKENNFILLTTKNV